MKLLFVDIYVVIVGVGIVGLVVVMILVEVGV